MAEKTEFYRWTFEGYDKALYSQSHTLAEILPELKIDESYVFTGGTSDWEIARKVESCTVKRLGGSGSIPFIFVVPYEYHTRVYIKQINYQINVLSLILFYFLILFLIIFCFICHINNFLFDFVFPDFIKFIK